MGESWLWLLLYRESRTLGCDWDEPNRELSGWFWCDWDEPYRESSVRGWDWKEERRE